VQRATSEWCARRFRRRRGRSGGGGSMRKGGRVARGANLFVKCDKKKNLHAAGVLV